MRSNRLIETLELLKFRVTDPEPSVPEAVHGAVITALNEEAIASAALANKGGINLIHTYEAFGTKMHGAVRQEIIFANHCAEAGCPQRWLSIPLVLTSHTWENGKNEQSHQDPSMAEALLGELSHVSRVVFPADFNTAGAVMERVYQTQGQIWTLVVPKADALPDLFTAVEAGRLVEDGGLGLDWAGYAPDRAEVACGQEAVLNMTDLALCSSQFTNGVAMRHGEVSRGLFPGYPIRAITNGVHAATWAAPSFQALYDRHLPDWRHDALSLRYAIGIPETEVWDAHQEAKRALIHHVNTHSDTRLDESVLTIGFARRATAYKRATLLFHDLGRLQALAADNGPLQVIFAGKAHPLDDEGKEMIRRVHEARKALGGHLAVTYLANYDMTLARLVCAGADVWLNTPLPPLEASGTSGMKAAVNGVPSLSVLDGWWIEGHIEGVTGWAIGEPLGTASEAPAPAADIDAHHAAALYDKLATSVLPCFYAERKRFIDIMRHAIALNGSFFNSQRMVWQYLHNAYQV